MSRTYTVLVAGLGKRGMHHASAFQGNPRFEVVGLCDIDASRAEAAAEKFPGAKCGTDSAALAKELKPDVFCFATLPNIRMPLIQAGIDCGAKLIAYEKPIATSTREARQIMDLTRKAGVKTVVSHQHRYGVHYQKVKAIIASGAIGRVHTVYGHATGWMMHMMTHMIDYAMWFNDYVEADWAIAQAAGRGKFADIHRSPDYIGGLVQFKNGVRGVFETGAGAPDVPEVDYWWRKCRIGAQGTEGFAEVLTGGGWRAITRDSNGVISGEGCMNYDNDMPPYIEDMAKWLDDDKAVHPCCGENAYKGFEVMMAMCRSVVERGQIALPLPDGAPEIDALATAVPERPVLLSMEANRKEYPG
ncbi:MAG TPA: Gfo/Idh/MocA family oxidoreductase [Candidatus Hydrogenedentes bacterium]|nr:Gfo/Idh/MocA family oxidoreductase [Candidatus Hydrogenedentota bacterium]HOS03960.1 Gfo/Idh/MocA family oxidoreductase [Candidatus Hydrogenedentota bacterium]